MMYLGELLLGMYSRRRRNSFAQRRRLQGNRHHHHHTKHNKLTEDDLKVFPVIELSAESISHILRPHSRRSFIDNLCKSSTSGTDSKKEASDGSSSKNDKEGNKRSADDAAADADVAAVAATKNVAVRAAAQQQQLSTDDTRSNGAGVKLQSLANRSNASLHSVNKGPEPLSFPQNANKTAEEPSGASAVATGEEKGKAAVVSPATVDELRVPEPVYCAGSSGAASVPPTSITRTTRLSECFEVDMTCAICLEEYQVGDKIIMLPCEHIFHSDCISHWLLRPKLKFHECPMCKVPCFPDEVKAKEEEEAREEEERDYRASRPPMVSVF